MGCSGECEWASDVTAVKERLGSYSAGMVRHWWTMADVNRWEVVMDGRPTWNDKVVDVRTKSLLLLTIMYKLYQ